MSKIWTKLQVTSSECVAQSHQPMNKYKTFMCVKEIMIDMHARESREIYYFCQLWTCCTLIWDYFCFSIDLIARSHSAQLMKLCSTCTFDRKHLFKLRKNKKKYPIPSFGYFSLFLYILTLNDPIKQWICAMVLWCTWLLKQNQLNNNNDQVESSEKKIRETWRKMKRKYLLVRVKFRRW